MNPSLQFPSHLKKLGLNVSHICSNNKKGFLLLPDFGDELYVDALNIETVNDLYQGALNNLLPIQSYPYPEIENFSLHQYTSDLYYREMRLFPNWYLERLKTSLSLKEKIF
ncbi:hypothetical protein [Coxiella-like endosymbiont of Rhipicephalus sanguineus]|uniref:hypothetical protein n=1 Tax=Coxiella-like endosymbiont of Rhipicephalus sanguineus TaxID=1955402 RepID=UPI00203BED47|nr:hypothetical protein [Coxiella-like endosymbiont of Rhipicephalus sanguineus]